MSELQLSDEHEGIIELSADAAKHIGQAYGGYAGLDDPMIEIAITPNRPDCCGVRGIARDLAARGLGTLKDLPKVYQGTGDFACPIHIHVAMPKEDKCAFWGRTIKDVKNGPSPDWLQKRLTAIGLKPINALVDITNYLSFDLARPLHVYDATKVKGSIEARLGKKGEGFTGLDDVSYEVDSADCVIADEKGVLGLAGVLGGFESGATLETTEVFIESAYFDAVRTAMTGRRHNIHSDARFRFERGIDPFSVDEGLAIATQYILEFCGGTPSKVKQAGAKAQLADPIHFNISDVKRLTGVELKDTHIKQVLVDLGFEVKEKGKSLDVTPPGWRPDIHGSADLVEEIIRIVGLDKITPTRLPQQFDVPRPVLTLEQKRVSLARRGLAAGGLTEAICWSFIAQKKAALFHGGGDEMAISNPISNDMSHMRPSLLPGLLDAAHRNFDKNLLETALFEIGNCYLSPDESGQFRAASGIRFGTAGADGAGRHWQKGGEAVDLYQVKTDVQSMLQSLGVAPGSYQLSKDVPDWFHPGRSSTLCLGPKIKLGTFGEIHPSILKAFGIKHSVVGFEVNLDQLPSPKKRKKAKTALKQFDLQAVARDFAFVVDKHVSAGDVIGAIKKAEKALITDVILFDVYEGEHVDVGKKSLAFEVRLQPKDKSFVDSDLESISDKIIANVQKATGGQLRA